MSVRVPLLCLVFAFGACGGGSSKQAKEPEDTGPTLAAGPPVAQSTATCEEASAVIEMMSGMPGSPSVADLKRVFVEQCQNERWTNAARACMKRAATRDDGQRCIDDELTNHQRQELGQALQRAIPAELSSVISVSTPFFGPIPTTRTPSSSLPGAPDAPCCEDKEGAHEALEANDLHHGVDARRFRLSQGGRAGGGPQGGTRR